MRLEWNATGERFFETGIDRGVFYPKAGPGVAWNGLISVNESQDGGDLESFYYDGVKYLDVIAAESFKATLEAFSAPVEFALCDGNRQLVPGLFASQQPRQTFGLSYRTLVGNELDDASEHYKLHLVYNATVSPSDRSSSTIGENLIPDSRSWDISTVPPPASLYKPTAHFIFDSRLIDRGMLEDIESFLYGRDGVDPRLLSQAEILDIVANTIEPTVTATI